MTRNQMRMIFSFLLLAGMILGFMQPAGAGVGAPAAQPPADITAAGQSIQTDLESQSQTPPDKPSPASCALLDNPKIRPFLSAAAESALLRNCGRWGELGRKIYLKENGLSGITTFTDVPVNDPLLDDTMSTTQSETTIAVNPETGTICSGWNDSGDYDTDLAYTGYGRSTDGGATFTDLGPMPLAGGQPNYGDPSIVWRRLDGKFYYTTLADNGFGGLALAIYRSDNDCVSWTYVSAPSSTGNDDKEFLTADNDPTSPYYGNLYVVWTDFSDSRITIKTSTNGGLTWSAPVKLSSPGASVQMSWPAVAPNGDVYAAWLHWDSYWTGTIDVEVSRSTDGGATFTPVTKPLSNAVNPYHDGATGSCGRPALNGSIRYFPGPQIVVGPNGDLHVVYGYDPDGHGFGDVVNVYYRRSSDNGVTWGSEVLLNDDGTTTDQWFPSISVGASNIVVSSWYDRRNDPAGNYLFDYYKVFSYDGGTTWTTNFRVSDVSSEVGVNFDPIIAFCYHGDYDQQVQDGAFVYIQWSDDRNIQNGHPDPDVWFEKEPVLTEIGTLAGYVTDAVTTFPISGALVEAVGITLTFQTNSGLDGFYSTIVASGTYTVSTSAFGYLPATITGVEVTEGLTTTQDIALEPAPSATVSGTVSDATTGWPLYASIEITGYPYGAVWTNPVTGFYSIDLPVDSTYEFTVNAWAPGYLPQTVSVFVPDDTTQDIALQADLTTCNAPGYTLGTVAYAEDFEADNGGFTVSGPSTWEWGVPTSGPGEAYSGLKAWATNLEGNYNNNENGYLISPEIDLSAYAGQAINLSWWQWLQTESGYDYAYVDVSDGTGWDTVYGPEDGDVDLDWTRHVIILDPAYAVENFRVRFHFTSDYSVIYPGWYVDDVELSFGECAPNPGGLVVGNVYDANNGDPLAGSTVMNDAGETTLTVATPDDPAVDDAFYTLFSPPGDHLFIASRNLYSDDAETVTVVEGGTVGQDFYLGIGELLVEPDSLYAVLGLGESATQPITLTNVGSGDSAFEITEDGAVPWLTEDPAAGYVDPGASSVVDVIFDSSVLTETGMYTTTLQVVTDDPGGVPAEVAVTLEVVAAVYGVSLAPESAALSGAPGDMVTYTLTLTNEANVQETFDLSASGNAWVVHFPVTQFTLEPGAAVDVTVHVFIPAEAGDGESDTATITAASANASDSSDLTTTAEVPFFFGVDLEPEASAGAAYTGEMATYMLTLVNTGNVTDTITVAASGNLWEVHLPVTEFTLAAGASVDVTVHVFIPADAADGATDEATITATGSGEASDEVGLTTTAKWRKVFLPIIIR